MREKARSCSNLASRGGGDIAGVKAKRSHTNEAAANPRLSRLRLSIGFSVGFVAALFLELTGIWYLMLIAGALTGIVLKKGKPVFFIGGAAVAVAWACYLGYHAMSGLLLPLADLFAMLAGLGEGMGVIFIVLTLLIGFVAGGLGAIHGALITQIVIGNKKKSRARPGEEPDILE